MGANLLCIYAVLRKGKRPKWKAAEQYIKSLKHPSTCWPTEFVERLNIEQPSEEWNNKKRKAEAIQLLEELGQFRALWEEKTYWRDVIFLNIFNHKVMLTANMSWGDSWNTYDLFERLYTSGTLKAGGFVT